MGDAAGEDAGESEATGEAADADMGDAASGDMLRPRAGEAAGEDVGEAVVVDLGDAAVGDKVGSRAGDTGSASSRSGEAGGLRLGEAHGDTGDVAGDVDGEAATSLSVAPAGGLEAKGAVEVDDGLGPPSEATGELISHPVRTRRFESRRARLRNARAGRAVEMCFKGARERNGIQRR